jgi:glucokinase
MLYIGGGIAAKILSLMQQGNLMQAFLQKGRMNSLLERIPVHLILNRQVGLLGDALCADL